jgi:hypothetical protein
MMSTVCRSGGSIHGCVIAVSAFGFWLNLRLDARIQDLRNTA